MRTRRLLLLAVLASAPLAAACGTGPTSVEDSGTPTCSAVTSTSCTALDSTRRKEQSPWN